jgi:flagellar FliJ protein
LAGLCGRINQLGRPGRKGLILITFLFKFQKVLQVKQTEEDLRLKKYADLQCQMRSLQESISLLKKEEQTICQNLKSLLGIDPHPLIKIQAEHHCLESCRIQIKVLEKKALELQAELEEARKRLSEAAKERKIMEKLKDYHFEDYLKDERQKEQKMLDEVGSRLYLQEN